MDIGQNLLRPPTDIVVSSNSRFESALQARDADHEEFVEVVGKDGKKVHPLKKRNRFVLREFEDTAVEGEPRQFAVKKPIAGERGVVRRGGFLPIVVEFGVGGPRGGVRLAHSSSPVGANR
ncbi:unannotated protein [freshwater metagenome]|uniref:Unannotated protein n=1 Tax=freshwater metagenome TaxID=449393 RepID=A0A6J7E490_9ZZZZ